MPRKKTFIDKMEEAAGIESPATNTTFTLPYNSKERITPGGTAREWTGDKPWSKKNEDGTAKPL